MTVYLDLVRDGREIVDVEIEGSSNDGEVTLTARCSCCGHAIELTREERQRAEDRIVELEHADAADRRADRES